MLNSEEYNLLLPFKEGIFNFAKKLSGSYKGNALPIVDTILQKRGNAPLCYSCDGNKIEAINDIYNMMVEFEANGG